MAHPIGRLLLAATACGACLCASVQAQTLDTVVIRAERSKNAVIHPVTSP